MAKIVGLGEMTRAQLGENVRKGAHFVVYQYAFSIIVMSFKRSTDIYYIPPGKSAVGKGLPFSLLTLVVGLWGFPWGPIYTCMAMFNNFRGGTDVTKEVLRDFDVQAGLAADRAATAQTAAAGAR